MGSNAVKKILITLKKCPKAYMKSLSNLKVMIWWIVLDSLGRCIIRQIFYSWQSSPPHYFYRRRSVDQDHYLRVDWVRTSLGFSQLQRVLLFPKYWELISLINWATGVAYKWEMSLSPPPLHYLPSHHKNHHHFCFTDNMYIFKNKLNLTRWYNKGFSKPCSLMSVKRRHLTIRFRCLLKS